MTALRFRGPVLPDGETRDLYVVDGRVTYEPVASAELVAEGWIVPGLVDAHCHVGLDAHGGVPEDEQERQATADRDAGAGSGRPGRRRDAGAGGSRGVYAQAGEEIGGRRGAGA